MSARKTWRADGPDSKWALAVIIAISAVAHAALFIGLGFVQLPFSAPAPTIVPLDVVAKIEDPVRAPAPPAVEPSPPPREPRTRVRRIETTVSSPPAQPASPLTSLEATSGEPVDFAFALSNETASPIASHVGPERAGGTAEAGPGGQSRQGTNAEARCLSASPIAPPLDERLESEYPERARALGLEGRCEVEVRILATGRASVARILTATEPDFGPACRRTVDGSQWTPAQDCAGRPVATVVRYRCVFRVE